MFDFSVQDLSGVSSLIAIVPGNSIAGSCNKEHYRIGNSPAQSISALLVNVQMYGEGVHINLFVEYLSQSI